MTQKTYISPAECAQRLNYNTRYFRSVVLKRDLIEGVHYFYSFNGRKIQVVWELVEQELLNGATVTKSANGTFDNSIAIPMANGGVCHA